MYLIKVLTIYLKNEISEMGFSYEPIGFTNNMELINKINNIKVSKELSRNNRQNSLYFLEGYNVFIVQEINEFHEENIENLLNNLGEIK